MGVDTCTKNKEFKETHEWSYDRCSCTCSPVRLEKKCKQAEFLKHPDTQSCSCTCNPADKSECLKINTQSKSKQITFDDSKCACKCGAKDYGELQKTCKKEKHK